MDWGAVLQIVGLISGLVLGMLFLGAGVATGLWLGRRVEESTPKAQLPAEQVVRALGGLFRWSSGMAVEVEEHRHELERLSGRVKAVVGSDAPLDPAATAELLMQMIAANERLQARLDSAESALKTQAEEVAAYLSEARTDALTGLPNRRAFDDELMRALAEWRRYGAAFSLLLVDADHFKGLNDRFGHLAGDSALVGVALALRGVLRECDVVARFGGEEFAVLLPHTDAAGAGLAAERVRHGIEETRFTFEGAALPVTVSCGVAQSMVGDEAASILKRCDEALYSAKRGGRNRCHWHTGERILALLCGVPTDEETSESPALAGTIELSSLDRACHDLRRRLMEVARR